MSKTHEITLYEFDELSARAQKRARDWYRKGLQFDDEYVLDDTLTCLRLLGVSLERRDISYSGFSCQGDGASFTGTWTMPVNAEQAIRTHVGPDDPYVSIARVLDHVALDYPGVTLGARIVRTSHRAYHLYSVGIEVFGYDQDDNEFAVKQRDAERIIEALRDCMATIYRTLENEYDWQHSDESVDETIRINEYEFTQDGDRFVVKE